MENTRYWRVETPNLMTNCPNCWFQGHTLYIQYMAEFCKLAAFANFLGMSFVLQETAGHVFWLTSCILILTLFDWECTRWQKRVHALCSWGSLGLIKKSHLGGSSFNKNFPREQVQSQANTMRVLIEMQETLMFEYNEVLKLHKAISYTPYFHS